MRRSCLAVCVSVLVASGVAATGALAAPGFQGEHAKPADLDAREGRVAPSARQRSLAAAQGLQVSWNRFGTPHTLTAADGVIADGLSRRSGGRRSPVGLAQPRAAGHRRRGGRRSRAGQRGTDRRRQRRPAAADLRRARGGPRRPDLDRRRRRQGRLRLVVARARHDRHRRIASSAPRRPYERRAENARHPGRLADRRAAPARLDRTSTRARSTGPRRRASSPCRRPSDGVRPAWETSLIESDGELRGVASFVDAETGEVLRARGARRPPRRQPDLEGVPELAAARSTRATDTRVRWCWLTPTHRTARWSSATRPRVPWDVDARTDAPTFTTEGNNAFAVHNWCQQRAGHGRHRARHLAARPRVRLPVDEPVARAALQPEHDVHVGRSATTSTLRGRTCSRCTTGCTTGRTTSASPRRRATCSRSTSVAAAWRTTPSAATRRPAASSGGPASGFAARDNANQLTGADGIAPITNMYLWQPIAAAFYAPVRGRRLRHVRDRARVRARDLEPDGRRPEPEPRRQPGRGDGRELVGPDGDRVSARERLRPAGGREPVRRRPVRHRRQGGGHPQLRDERQPAQLLRRRLRLRVQPGALPRAHAGPRRRRDLERDELRHPAGVHRALRSGQPRHPARPACAASWRPPPARAAGAGCSWCSTPGC